VSKADFQVWGDILRLKCSRIRAFMKKTVKDTMTRFNATATNLNRSASEASAVGKKWGAEG